MPPVGPTLRAPTDSDEAFFLSLFASTMPPGLVAPGIPLADQPLVAMQYRAQTEGYVHETPDLQDAVIELDGEPVGRERWHDAEDELYVIDIVLAPEHRRKGVGTARVAAWRAAARDRGVAIGMRAVQGSDAHTYWLRHDFEVVADEGLWVRLRWEPIGRGGDPVDDA